jgi:hypothetical protein
VGELAQLVLAGAGLTGVGMVLGAAVVHRLRGAVALLDADDERDRVVAMYPSTRDGRNYGGERYGDEATDGVGAHDR